MQKWFTSYRNANSFNNCFHKKKILNLNSGIKKLRKTSNINLELRLNSPQFNKKKIDLTSFPSDNSTNDCIIKNKNNNKKKKY